MSEPYSYLDLQKKLAIIDKKSILNLDIYYHRELLCYSKEGRRVDIITITSAPVKANKMKREKKIPGLFPESFDSDQRPYKFGKQVNFISARVHPGEVPSSHVMDSLLDFLTAKNDA